MTCKKCGIERDAKDFGSAYNMCTTSTGEVVKIPYQRKTCRLCRNKANKERRLLKFWMDNRKLDTSVIKN